MKDVFDGHYKQQFADAGIDVGPNGDLQHFLSDVATMQLIRWKEGGFGMAAHNYDGGNQTVSSLACSLSLTIPVVQMF